MRQEVALRAGYLIYILKRCNKPRDAFPKNYLLARELEHGIASERPA